MEIRPYQNKDETDVVRLWRLVFPDNPPWNDPLSDIHRKLTMQRELFLVAVLENKVVGTIMAGFDGHRGWIHLLAVLPEFRKLNIGRDLMLRVERDIKAYGCTKVNLQVRATNKGVIEFYRKLGYLVEDHVSMGKLFSSTPNDNSSR